MKILVAVDGSKPSQKAVKLLIDHAGWYRSRPRVELVAVHLPVPGVGHLPRAQLAKYYAEEGAAMLAAARRSPPPAFPARRTCWSGRSPRPSSITRARRAAT